MADIDGNIPPNSSPSKKPIKANYMTARLITSGIQGLVLGACFQASDIIFQNYRRGMPAHKLMILKGVKTHAAANLLTSKDV